MIRTKHLLLISALVICATSTGVLGVLVAGTSADMAAVPQNAAVILSTPAAHYSAVVDAHEPDTRSAFIEKIRDSYVPPPPAARIAGAESASTPVPLMSPEPESLPAFVVVEEAPGVYMSTTTPDEYPSRTNASTTDEQQSLNEDTVGTEAVSPAENATSSVEETA